MMMQFACTARSADDEDYRPLAETPLTLDFAYDHGVSSLADPAVWQVTLTNNADAPWRGVVKLEHCVACDAPRIFLARIPLRPQSRRGPDPRRQPLPKAAGRYTGVSRIALVDGPR